MTNTFCHTERFSTNKNLLNPGTEKKRLNPNHNIQN